MGGPFTPSSYAEGVILAKPRVSGEAAPPKGMRSQHIFTPKALHNENRGPIFPSKAYPTVMCNAFSVNDFKAY